MEEHKHSASLTNWRQRRMETVVNYLLGVLFPMELALMVAEYSREFSLCEKCDEMSWKIADKFKNVDEITVYPKFHRGEYIAFSKIPGDTYSLRFTSSIIIYIGSIIPFDGTPLDVKKCFNDIGTDSIDTIDIEVLAHSLIHETEEDEKEYQEGRPPKYDKTLLALTKNMEHSSKEKRMGPDDLRQYYTESLIKHKIEN